jgi:RNA polymerase sigma-70 factor (ECF subfamily)
MHQLVVMVDRPERSSGERLDAAAWEAAYRAHAVSLTRLATVLVGRDAAHDLVADTVLRCVAREQWWTVANPGGYLTRALVNAASTHHRSDRARIQRERVVAGWRTAGGADHGAADDVGDTGAVTALRSLSPSQAAVVYLLYWEDLTIPDAARQLGISEGRHGSQAARPRQATTQEGDLR